jgi:hypothetical protein
MITTKENRHFRILLLKLLITRSLKMYALPFFIRKWIFVWVVWVCMHKVIQVVI